MSKFIRTPKPWYKSDPANGLSVNKICTRVGVGVHWGGVDIARTDKVVTNLFERYSIHNKANKANDECIRINWFNRKIGRSL